MTGGDAESESETSTDAESGDAAAEGSLDANDGGANTVLSISSGVSNYGNGGSISACALTSAGDMKCWVGTGKPAEVPTLSGDVADISYGGFGEGYIAQSGVACAVTTTGAAWCWGANSNGELGNGSTNASSVPTPVSTLTSGVSSISVGQGNGGTTVCAVKTDGTLWCWGYNGYSQLGNGSSMGASAVPVQLTGFADPVAAVSVGNSSSCVLTSGGAVQCWGNNSSGQLGNGLATSSAAPVQVTGLTSGVTAVSVGIAYACAIVGGIAECWGNDGFGATKSPATVMGLTSGVTSLSVGGFGIDSCAVVNGAAQCWGVDNYGELGDDSTTSSAIPVQAVGLTSGVAAVAVGYISVCALKVDSSVWCWGGHANTPTVPVRVTGFPD